MAGGRPTEYSPEFCERVVEYGKEGKSMAAMAAMLDVSKDTLYEWKKVHPEFSDAIKLALTYSQLWWESKGQSGMETPGFNATIWAKNMSNRFRDDWADVKSLELSGKDGAPIQVQKIERVIIDGSKNPYSA